MKDETGKPKLARSTLTVNAKHCLWLAWAGDLAMTPGPEGENNESYRPLSVPVSGGAVVTIAIADPSQRWRHHPSAADESGAGGLSETKGLENPAYQSATYNSQNINALTTNLNKLIAIFGGDSPPSTSTNQEIVGTGATLTAPIGATKLFFGFHDGHEWSNNSGVIDINVTVQTI